MIANLDELIDTKFGFIPRRKFIELCLQEDKAKTLDDLVKEQERFCKEEFLDNIVKNKEDIVKLYVERDYLMQLNTIEYIQSIIRKISNTNNYRVICYAIINDLIYDYQTGKLIIEPNKLREQITELQIMTYDKNKFENSKYAKLTKEKFNKLVNNIQIYHQDLKKLYNDLTFGELLASGY